MIVFNVPAVIVGLISGALLFVLELVAPNVLDGSAGGLLICMVFLAVGTIGEAVGLKARIFWLPVWSLSLLAGGYEGFQLWGWWGVGGAVVTAFVLLGGLVGLGTWMDVREWKRAPVALQKATDGARLKDRDQFWKQLGDAFYVPSSGTFNRDHCKHNARVMELMELHLPPECEAPRRELVQRLRAGFDEGTAASEAYEPAKDAVSALQTLIAARGVAPLAPPDEQGGEDAGTVCPLPEHEPSGGWYVAPQIPDKKLDNAIEAYAGGVDRARVIALGDGTVFGSGKEGILLTDDTLIAGTSKGTFSTLLEQIGRVELGDGFPLYSIEIALRSGEQHVISTTSFNGKREAIARFLRSRLDTDAEPTS